MKKFERVIIDELLLGGANKTIVFPDQENDDKVEFADAGYFLTLKDPSFPKSRAVLNKPEIRGQLGGVDVGYRAFVENHEFTLECYSCEQEIYAVNREQGFQRAKTYKPIKFATN